MLGYEESDLNDMRYAIDSAVLILGKILYTLKDNCLQ